jgi:hypothetical protein
MRISRSSFAVLTAACSLGVAVPRHAMAQVSNEDFNALKKTVDELVEQVRKLQQTHQQDQQLLERDQQMIHQLKQEVGETSVALTNAVQKTEDVARVQSNYAAAKSGPGPLHNFTMVGDAEVQFGKTAGQHSAFVLADFAPIFLFRGSDNLLFEAGFDVMLNNNVNPDGSRAMGSSTSVSMSFGQMDYLLNDYVTLAAGDLLLPLGTYSERSAGWLNKIPDDPMARDFLPGSGVGVQLRGSVPIGGTGDMFTYSVYGVNGPSSGATNSIASASAIDLGGNVGDTPNWHSNPSGGGRLGWLHSWKPHYDVELGVSGQTGEWSDSGNRSWSAAVVDAAFHYGPNIELKGEYINTWVQTDDLGTLRPRGWWVQGGYKLAGLNLELPYINNVELVGRYDFSNDAQGTKTDRYTVGYVYYFSNTLLFEGDYEIMRSSGPAALPPNAFVFQLSYGF